MWRFTQALFQPDEDEENSFLEEDSDNLCSLSPTQRLYGFGVSVLAGVVCMILSLVVLARPIKFAILFTFGNLLAVGSTAFLFGPKKQIRMMFDAGRIYATCIYLGCVVVAFIFALWLHSKILTILAVICEICALIWYTLSYIPFARSMVSGLMWAWMIFFVAFGLLIAENN